MGPLTLLYTLLCICTVRELCTQTIGEYPLRRRIKGRPGPIGQIQRELAQQNFCLGRLEKMVEYIPYYSALGGLLPVTRLASRKILILSEI